MSGIFYRIGYAIRETGQALERTGCRLQGINSFEEPLTRLKSVLNLENVAPKLGRDTYVAPTAAVVGKVNIGDNASVWYNSVVRGDVASVTIGDGSNLQDGVYVGTINPGGHPTKIGDRVSIGHGAWLGGCTVGDQSLIGMGAVLQEGCKVEGGSIVAAGAVVETGTTVVAGQIWGGNPARKLRELKPEERQYLTRLPARYTELAAQHQEVLGLMYKQMDAIVHGNASSATTAA